MIVRNLRVGYDGGGMCCGPVEGAYGAEVCVMDKEGHNHWVLAIEVIDSQFVYVSPFPLLDEMIESNDPDVDGNEEVRKMERISTECYDYDYGLPDADMKKSEFAKAIHLARIALYKYKWDEMESPEKFLEPYRYENIDEIELPPLKDDREWVEDD